MQKAHDSSYNDYWRNKPNITTPIVQDQLNRIETTIDTIDDRVVTFDTTKANQTDLLADIKNVSFDSSTGTFTFTKQNNTTIVIDTDIEKIAVNFDYDDDPQSAHYQNLIITLDDGTVKYVDMSALITEYEFTDSAVIHFTITNGVISADVINGSITAEKLQPNFLADCVSAKEGAETAETNAETAETNALAHQYTAEAWAKGTKNDVPVTPSDAQYHDNAYYWAQQARAIVGDKVDSFNGRTGTVFAEDGDYESQMIVPETGAIVGQVPVVRNVGTGQDVKLRYVNEDLDIGLKPHIIVISETGSTVTLTKGTKVIYASETSPEHFEADVTEFGTWVIDSVLGGDDAQVSLVVDAVKIYTVDDSHWHADITVTYPTGGTCSCSKSGTTTLYATGSPYTFTVHESGTYTITATANGETYTDTVEVTTSGQTESLTIPEGSTVTPTDSVATLLSCAGIHDTSITSMSDLLADTTTLLAVINSNNAIDYLVRSTGFTGIALVPTMTSDTTPSGTCFADVTIHANYAPWKAFDGDATTYWGANDTSSHYVGYQFTSATLCKAVGVYTGSGGTSASAYVSSFKVQASNDGTTWDDLSTTFNITPADGFKIFSFANDTAYTRYRIQTLSSQSYTYLNTLQFFTDVNVCANSDAMSYIGLNNYAANTLLGSNNPNLVPIMTDNTHPSGEASANPVQTGYDAYKAFDGDESTFWASGQRNGWIQYEFPTAKVVRTVHWEDATTTQRTGTFKIQGSNDGFVSDTHDLYSGTATAISGTVTFDNNTAYKYYRFLHVTPLDNVGMKTIQFFEKDYDPEIWLNAICNSTYFESVLNVKVPTMTSYNTPSGVVSESLHSSSYVGWYVFDGNNGSFWASGTNANEYVEYDFGSGNENVVHKIELLGRYANSYSYLKGYIIKASNDGTNWDTLYSGTHANDSTWENIILSNSTAYRYYRLYKNGDSYGNATIQVCTLQFYGREDV